jgi:hypothetical protein
LIPGQSHEFTVETGNAVAAVRDTRFSVQVTDGTTLVSVAEGELTLTALGQTVTVKAGEQAAVEPDRPPSLPEPMSNGERALWATEGEMSELAPPAIEMWVDVYCALNGPAGNPASRNPETQLGANIQSPKAVEIAVESPNGETIILPRYSDFWGGEGRFHKSIPGLPQVGGTYIFTTLDADGVPIPGAVASDVYLGGYEPDPPANVQAEVVKDGILVTWDPSPIISGAFDPGASPPVGFYQLTLWDAEGETLYSWGGGSQPKTAHLVPLRRQDFAPGASGLALQELEGKTFRISIDAFSSAPEETAGHGLECQAQDPEEGIRVVVKEGQVQIKEPRAFTTPPDFRQAIAALSAPIEIDFEDIDASPVNDTYQGREPFDENRYAGQGIVFSSPDKLSLYIAPGGLNWNASNSLSVEAFPYDSIYGPTNRPPINDDLLITFNPPVVAVGFTLIDLYFENEVKLPDSPGYVQFFDAEGQEVQQVNLPLDYAPFRAFVGFVSEERLIQTIKVRVVDDYGDVNYDDFIFVPVE